MLTPRILWGALITSTFVYLYVLQVAAPEDADPEPMMLPALGVAALVAGVLSVFLPAYLHGRGAMAAELEVEEVPDPDASVMFRDQTPTVRRFAKPDAVVSKGMALYMTPLILGMALGEAVAIFGFVLGVLGFELPMILPFFVASWVLMGLRFPRWSSVLGPLERAQKARFVPD